jgi:hypothetical protein
MAIVTRELGQLSSLGPSNGPSIRLLFFIFGKKSCARYRAVYSYTALHVVQVH